MSPSKPFTGRRMFAILVAFFGTVIAVNFAMASYASSTFGGIVVENSYVASQEFNRWLDEADAEKALGWRATSAWRRDGRLAVTLAGPPADARLTAVARHPLGRTADRALAFDAAGPDTWVSREALPRGRWTLRLTVAADGRTWRHEEPIG